MAKRNLRVIESRLNPPTPASLARIALLDDVQIAAAYVSPPENEFMLNWPLEPTHLRSILQQWIDKVLPLYDHFKVDNKKDPIPEFFNVECWIQGVFSGTRLKNPTPDQIIQWADSRRITRGDRIAYLLLENKHDVLELAMDGKNDWMPQMATCTLSSVRLLALVPFFSNFHEHSSVKTDREIAIQLLDSDTSKTKDALNILSPSPVGA
jgi:hypothetical protein